MALHNNAAQEHMSPRTLPSKGFHDLIVSAFEGMAAFKTAKV